LEAGEGLEYASGSFRARFHYYKPNQLLISTIQQRDFFRFKGSQVAPTATMFLRTEPSLLDQFIAALPALDASDGGQAVLNASLFRMTLNEAEAAKRFRCAPFAA